MVPPSLRHDACHKRAGGRPSAASAHEPFAFLDRVADGGAAGWRRPHRAQVVHSSWRRMGWSWSVPDLAVDRRLQSFDALLCRAHREPWLLEGDALLAGLELLTGKPVQLRLTPGRLAWIRPAEAKQE